MAGSIGGLFLLVKGYFTSKNRGWRCDWEREVEQWPPFFKKSYHLLVESPGKRAFLSTIQTDLSYTPFFQNAL